MKKSTEDTQHNIWLVTLDGALHRAPVPPSPTSVLDVGTGSGIWAVEFARQHPSCHVMGIDLSPVKANSAVPEHCTFSVHDAESPRWDFAAPNTFDLIHSRMLVMGMRDWRSYFRNCYHHLKPGGWIEVHEIAFPMRTANPDTPAETPFLRWGHVIHEGLAKGGIDGGAVYKFSQHLEDVGFENIVEEKLPWPVAPWPEDEKGRTIGHMEADNLNNGMEGMTMGLLTKNMGWTREEVGRFVEEIRADLYDAQKKYLLDV
ncbi:MAG: hypothetical protein Q9207_002170 [Kuettlingeria erythrocarpa]